MIKSIENKELLEEEGYFAVCFKRVPGEAIDDTDMSDEIMFSYGQSLGRLHVLSKKCPKIAGKWDEEKAFAWIRNVFTKNRVPEKMKIRLAKLVEKYKGLEKNSDNYGLIHYDFEVDNVFYDSKTKKCHVIDFDDSMYNFYYLDYMKALDSIDEEYQKEAFKKGYESMITADEATNKNNETTAPIFDEFWSIYAYARLIYALSEQGEENPDWKVELVKKLTKEVKRIENEE